MVAENKDNVKDFIYDYCRILHLQNMPVDVRAHFDEFAKGKDFTGNMKYWPDLFDKELPTMDDEANWKKLYNLFQSVFENMSQHKKEFATKTETTNKFFNDWFGDDKLFRQPEPISGVEERVKHFAEFLKDHKDKLNLIFNKKSRYVYLPEDFDYDSFVEGVSAGKYKTDPDLRDTLFSIVNYTQRYANSQSSFYSDWPQDLKYDFTQPAQNADGSNVPALPTDTDEWFVTSYNPGFKYRAKEIFNKLLTSSVVFEDFKNYDSKGTISKEVQRAVTATDYSNKDSKDYVSSKYNNQKNIFERAKDKFNDVKENLFDPWFNILNGTRRFFSPYARNIVEAVSKVKVKGKDGKERKLSPTDGLKGILDNKDAILKKLSNGKKQSPKAKAHFEWFAGKLATYSEQMPEAFEGALHNSSKLMAIVCRVIVDAVQESKVAEAESALELLSCTKYGIMHSQIMNAFRADKTPVLTNKDLFINKSGVGRMITGGLEKTFKFATLAGIGMIATAHNLTFRGRTKFNGKFKDIEKAEGKWKKDNDIAGANQTSDALGRALNTANGDLSSFEAQLNALGGEAAIEAAIRNIPAKEQEIEQKKQEIEQKEQEIEQKKYEIEQKKYEIEQKKAEILAQQQNIAKNDREIAARIKVAKEHKKRKYNNDDIIKAQGDKAVAEGEIKVLDGDIIGLEQEIATTQSEIRGLENDISVLQNDVANIESSVESLRAQQQILNDYKEKKKDVELLTSQKNEVDKKKETWDTDHVDKYLKLMAHWDKLESFWLSHKLNFWAKAMRNKFLDRYGEKDANDKGMSQAEKTSDAFFEAYKRKYGKTN